MQNHVKVYYDHFSLGEQDIVYCEFEYVVNGKMVKAVDIHHIDGRGKDKDRIENLMGLSRQHHDAAHRSWYQKKHLKEVHKKFLRNNPYFK